MLLSPGHRTLGSRSFLIHVEFGAVFRGLSLDHPHSFKAFASASEIFLFPSTPTGQKEQSLVKPAGGSTGASYWVKSFRVGAVDYSVAVLRGRLVRLEKPQLCRPSWSSHVRTIVLWAKSCVVSRDLREESTPEFKILHHIGNTLIQRLGR